MDGLQYLLWGSALPSRSSRARLRARVGTVDIQGAIKARGLNTGLHGPRTSPRPLSYIERQVSTGHGY